MTDDSNSVKRRAVFFVGGFDPKSPEAFYTRMDRENGRFEELWGANVERAELTSQDSDIFRCRFDSSGEDLGHKWSTQTDFNFMTLDDIVLKDFARPLPIRFWRYLKTFLDYVFSGTAFRFVGLAWRFSLYFFYPAIASLACLFGSYWLASLVAGLGFSAAPILAIAVFAAALLFCYHYVLNHKHVLHLMDLWSFSREYLHQKRPDMDDKLNRMADRIFEAAASGDYDEILTIGHSTGGALILDASARVYERHPEFAALNNNLTVLTVGSTALKIGIHPAGGWFRQRLERLFSQTPTRWIEYQSVLDIINFYRTVPSELMGFATSMQQPMITKRLQIKRMVSPEVYRRMRRHYFRIHYQFVFGNTRKYLYDFPAFCFGPARLTWRVLSVDRHRSENPFTDNLSGIKEDNK
ncbi:MAG: lipase [Rhizobiaceae bacterium]